mgnify:FL=1
MIELSAPAVLREARPERFTVTGFTCPECNGNGWGWRQVPDGETAGRELADRRGWGKVCCPTCLGTGTVDADVTVSWRASE